MTDAISHRDPHVFAHALQVTKARIPIDPAHADAWGFVVIETATARLLDFAIPPVDAGEVSLSVMDVDDQCALIRWDTCMTPVTLEWWQTPSGWLGIRLLNTKGEAITGRTGDSGFHVDENAFWRAVTLGFLRVDKYHDHRGTATILHGNPENDRGLRETFAELLAFFDDENARRPIDVEWGKRKTRKAGTSRTIQGHRNEGVQ